MPWTHDPGTHAVRVDITSGELVTESRTVYVTTPETTTTTAPEVPDRQRPRTGSSASPRPSTPSRPEAATVRRGQESYGSWIAVIASLPMSEYAESDLPAEMDARGVPWARYLRSDDFGSLRPGYWVLYDGPYASGAAAVEQCRWWGRATPSECYGRPLTDDLDDRDVVAE